MGAGNDYTLGDVGGEATHTLSVDEMPKHSHGIYYYNANESGSFGYNYTNGKGKASAAYETSSGILYNGNNQPHNNLPSYQSVNMWHRIA